MSSNNRKTAVTSEINVLANAWDGAFNAGALAKLAAFYAPNGSIVPAGGQQIDGPKAIGDFFADIRSQGLTRHEIKVAGVVNRGDTLVATGSWKLTSSSEADTRSFGGNWINVCARDGANWKILLHTWN